jgi:hypothetical protein
MHLVLEILSSRTCATVAEPDFQTFLCCKLVHLACGPYAKQSKNKQNKRCGF